LGDAPEIVKFISFALLSTFSESKSSPELLVPAAIGAVKECSGNERGTSMK